MLPFWVMIMHGFGVLSFGIWTKIVVSMFSCAASLIMRLPTQKVVAAVCTAAYTAACTAGAHLGCQQVQGGPVDLKQ